MPRNRTQVNLLLQPPPSDLYETALSVSGSKSESNRALFLQALYPSIHSKNRSDSDDTRFMLQALKSREAMINIHHAGTAMRFLTAFFAMQEGREVILTGSQRMKERPIAPLVNALRRLGADIRYREQDGFPPLHITGTKLHHHKVHLKADISSQYISALLLIAPKLPNGLQLTLEGKITSAPYIKMTLALLNTIGVKTSFEDQRIRVYPRPEISEHPVLHIESDWSSASYFYSIMALCKAGTRITLSSYKKNSLQGDAVIAEIYKRFGVSTSYADNSIVLTKTEDGRLVNTVELNLTDTPDIAQTITVTCFGLGIPCTLSGLHTLKIKETDRLQALKTELQKLGASVAVTNEELMLKPSETIRENQTIATYNDHRMAMAFAPLAVKVPIVITNAKVVSKSCPGFWDALKKLRFDIREA